MAIQFLLILSLTFYVQSILNVSITWYAAIPALLYIICKRFKGGIAICYVVILGFILWQFDSFMNGIRLLINEIIIAFAKWGYLLPLQVVTDNDATLIIGVLLVCWLIIYQTWTIIATVVLSMLLPVLLQVDFPIIAFTLLWTVLFIALSHEKTKQFSVLQIGAIIAVCSILLPLHLPAPTQLGATLVQLKDRILYDASEATQFTHGDLTNLHDFEKTATPAFHIAMQEPRALYLKSFVGEDFNNSWLTNGAAQLEQLSLLHALQDKDAFMATQFAQASSEPSQVFSVEMIKLHNRYPLVPYELASPLDTFKQSGPHWQSTQFLGTETYKMHVSTVRIFNYPTIASQLYEKSDEDYLQLEALHNQFSYTQYTKLDQDVKTLLSNHFEAIEHTSYETTITAVLQQLSMLAYNETPASTNDEFLPFLLEESKEGYSVHYATLATLLFRHAGVPARYVEGYIITNDDVKDDQKEVIITSDSRHAWTEIYVDWIGWVPVEVTPGYSEKMPKLSNATTSSTSQLQQGVTAKQETPEQISEPDMLDEQTEQAATTKKFNYAWLWLLLVPALGLLYVLMKRLTFERQFNRFIAKCNAKWHTNLPMHHVIERLQSHEANTLYQLYIQKQYSDEPLTNEQLKDQKKILNVVKQQWRSSFKSAQ